MSKTTVRLTVYFETPFWVGVVERIEEESLTATKLTFGSEPKDYEVYEMILRRYSSLEFGPAVENEGREVHLSPKRMQREISRQLQAPGIGTKAQLALKLQHEQNKHERKVKSREQRMLEEKQRYESKQQRKKEKHRGR